MDGPAREAIAIAAEASLGSFGIKEAQRLLRLEMVRLAVAREGSIRRAAVVLGIDRKHVRELARNAAPPTSVASDEVGH